MKPVSSLNKTRTFSLLLTLAALPAVYAVDEVWDGGTDGAWATLTNWVSDTGVPGALDQAQFNTAGGADDTIDLGAGVTVRHIAIDTAAAPYIFGSGAIGSQTLTIDQAGANPDGINMSSGVANDQTVNANIVMGDGSVGQFRFTNMSNTNDLILNGDISDGTGGIGGIQTLSFGNFSANADKVIINGNIPALTTATRIQINVYGADVEMNGTVTGVGNTQRTTVRDGGSVTVGATGKIGEGATVVAEGTLNLNNLTTPQLFDNGLTFGNTGTGDGDSTVNIAPGATLDQDGDITYVADGNVANTGLLSGGTVDLSGGNRNITVNDNPLVAGSELTLSTTFRGTNSGTANAQVEDLTIRGAGTASWNSTFGTTALELVDILSFEAKKTVIEAGGADLTGVKRNVLVRQRNNALLSDFEVELDINGQEVLIDGDLTLSAFSSTNITVAQNVRISDSADSPTSKIRLLTAAGNDMIYNAGTTNDNITTFIEADIQFEDGGSAFNIGDGASPVDVEISGTITDDNAGGRNIDKLGDGTLLLTATDNLYNVLNIQRGTAQITNVGALGDNDIALGSNTTDGTFEYVGAGETIGHQIRVGDNNADVGTRVGDGTVSNTGAGTLTFSAGVFNELRADALTNRTLTFDGTGEIVVSGTVQDNVVTVATIGVTKDGANTVSLNGSNTYTGDTVVNAGRLNVNGTVGGNLTVAAAASVGGNATFAGTVTLGAASELRIDAAGGGAITAEGAIDTSAGVNVFIDTAGGGVITVLNYDNTEVNNIAVGHFTLAGGVTPSARGAGAFVDTGSSITIDLGFGDRAWDNASGDSLWTEGLGGSVNWIEGDNLFFDGDNVLFTNSDVNALAPATDQTVVLSASVAPGGMEFSNNTNLYIINDNGGAEAIGGAGLLTKSGTAVVRINSANTYTGGTLISQGQLAVGNDSALGTGTVTMTDAGNDPDLLLIGLAPTIANNFVLENAGNVKRISYQTAAGNAVLTGDIVNNETAIWTFQVSIEPTASVTMSGVISGTGAVRNRNGTLNVTNVANTFAGPLRSDNGGTAVVSSIADSGVPSSAGAGDYMIAGSDNGDGTVSYTGTGGSTDRQVQTGSGAGNTPDVAHSGSGTVASNGTGALIFTNATFSRQDTAGDGKVGARTLTLAGSNTDANEVQGAITDNAGVNAPTGTLTDNTVGLIKDGVGTWCLSGTNTYTGDTTVNNGELCFSAADSLPAGADVYVDASGGGILNLDFTGTVSINSLYIDGALAVAGEWGSVASGAANTSPSLSGAGKLNATVGSTAIPNIIDITVNVGGDVIITLDGSATGLSVLQSNDIATAFAAVTSTPSGNTLTVLAADADPNADGDDFYRVSQ